MTAVRKIVDSSVLVDIFDLPPSFKNKKVEVVLFPVDESSISQNSPQNSQKKNYPLLTMAQIKEWAKAPEIQSLVGVLKGKSLPVDISISDIRNERLIVTRNTSDFSSIALPTAIPVVTPDELLSIITD